MTRRKMAIGCGGLLVLFIFGVSSSGQERAAGEFSGTVVDAATNQPLARSRVYLAKVQKGQQPLSATVFAAEQDIEAKDGASVSTRVTDINGRFTFHMAPGNYRVYARHDQCAPWGETVDTQTTVHITPGASLTQKIALEPVGTIRGRVVDTETGEALLGGYVYPLKWHVAEGSRALVFSGEPARIERTGQYIIRGLPPGQYVLYVQPSRPRFIKRRGEEEYRNTRLRGYVPSYYPGVEKKEYAHVLSLLPGQSLSGIDFALLQQPVGSIRGRTIIGDELGESTTVAFVLGTMEKQGGSVTYWVLASHRSDSSSGFEVEHLPPGRYWLAAHTEEEPTQRKWAFTTIHSDSDHPDDISLVLRRGLAVKGQFRLAGDRGTVSVPPNVRIYLSPLDRSRFAGERPPALVSENGEFLLTNVTAGAFDIEVVGLPKDLAVSQVLYNGVKVIGRSFTLNDAAMEQTVELYVAPATGIISVNVQGDAKTRAGVQVVLVPDWATRREPVSEARVVATDSDGSAVFPNLLPGTYRLVGFPPGVAWKNELQEAVTNGRGVEVQVSDGGVNPYQLKVPD